MAAQYHSLFTTQGLALLREAIQNGTKLGITHMSYGDGNGALPIPDASFTKMLKEVYRTPLNRLAASKENPNWLEADGVIPSAVGGFNIREVGLWAGNIMVAYANYPPTYKPSSDQGTAQIKTIRIVLQIDNNANFELKIDASVVMATIDYVDEQSKKLINFADNYQTAQEAIDTSENQEVVLKSNDYLAGIKLNKANLIGRGYATRLPVPANNFGVKCLQTVPNWDKTQIKNLKIEGVELNKNIGIVFDPDDAVAGRRNVSYVSLSNLDIAINKPMGNTGNTYSSLNIFNCNYAVKAKSVWLPQEMHSGNDTWKDFQIDNVHVWAFDYTDLTGGGAVHIKDGIIEYCDGGGIRFEYSDRYPPFIAPRISNVWFEQVAKASKVTRDGVDEIPRAIKLVNTAMCIIENCKLDNIELVNSTALALNCRVDSINMVLDSSSNLIVENAFINGSVPKNITIKSIAKQSYPVHYGANLTLRGTDIVGVQRMPQGASRGIGITFTGSIGKNWALDGTSIVYATSQLDDNGSECAYLNLDKTKVNVFPSITTPANHWVVWGISVKAVGDVTGTFEFNYDYKLGNIILEKDKWVHSFGIVKAPTAAMRIRAKFTPTSDMALKLKNYFIVSFEKESDAIAFANSRMSIDTYPKSMQVEYDPPPLAAGATTFKNLDCLGISPVDNILCSFSNPLNGVNLWTEVSNDNVITVFMKNPTTNVIDLASGILSVKIL